MVTPKFAENVNKMGKNEIIDILKKAFQEGNKLLIFGNGGSAAESDHFAAEFIGIGLPAISLTNPAVVTSLSNDHVFQYVFSLQIEALGRPGDVAIGLSSSGESLNVNTGLQEADKRGLIAIDLPREGNTTSEIQNNQLALIHQVYEAFL